MKGCVQWARKGGSIGRTLSARRRALGAGLALIWIATAVDSQPAAAAPYTILDLGTLGAVGNSYETIPNAINASGQVAGQAYNAGPDAHAFLNDLTGMYDLGALGNSGNISGAFAINDSGQSVGYSQVETGRSHGWLYSVGVMRDLGTLGGLTSNATGINNAGQVVGVAELPGPDAGSDGPRHAFLYDELAGMRDLGPFAANSINDAGQIVGHSYSIPGKQNVNLYEQHVLLWEKGAMRDLGTLPGYPIGYATSLNASGQVVGWAEYYYSGNSFSDGHAFLYDSTGMHDLGTLGGRRSQAMGINGAGKVVGWSLTSANDWKIRRAFIYTGSAMLDLNTLLPAGSGWTLQEARGINDSGQIVGVGTHDGVTRGFLMTPGIDPRSLPPQAPTGLSVTMASTSELDLAWTDNSNNEYGFEIEMLRDGAWGKIATTSANTVRFAHTGLASYADYGYRVRAINPVGASAWSNEVDPNTSTRPRIQITSSDINFGSPPVGSHTTRSVEIDNLGNGPLVLGDITLSGGITAEYALAPPNCAGTTVAPGASCTVNIVFTPASPHDAEPPNSPDAARLTIASNDPSPEGPQSVTLRGGGTGGAVNVSPAGLDFGAQPIGSSSGSQLFLVQNTGNAPLDIASVDFTGANAAEFAIMADGCTGAHLLPGRVATVSVRFTPTAVGSRTAILAIHDDVVGGPQLVPLTGTGTQPIASITPASVDFGEQLVGGASADQPIIISNTGTAPLTIHLISFSGANPGEFSATADISGFTLAPGQSGTLQVRFSPHATGSRGATLSISDSAPGSPHLITLSGTGIAPSVKFGISQLNSPGKVSFGRQPLGTTSGMLSATLTNSGTAPLTIFGVSLKGANAGDFLLASDSEGGTLAPGTSRTFSLRFTPHALGSRAASLSITDNAPGSPHAITLDGSGAPALPAAPDSLTVKAGWAGQLQLAWSDHSTDETAFALWRKSDTSDWTRIAVLPPNRISYVDLGLAAETHFTYRVRAISTSGASAWSNEAIGLTVPPAPSAPSGLTVRVSAAMWITLTWQDNSANETAFALWRKTSGGEWVRIGVTAPNAVSYLDRSAKANTTYLYRVRAINNSGASDWSGESSVTAPP